MSTLPPSSQLGNYEILDRLGAGGMGEVYRARDTRLGRVVAIKVILDAYASDPERAARFQREAKMLAALNHPRIAALYGLEQADGVHFLVMELVEGETLAERIARGPLQVEEAIGIALQIAEALEAAHEKGVIHRDLKPANVKITPDQQIKVLDFGLAKAVESDAAAAAEAANSPTLSMMATQAGIILGTAAYMSPEQAKGLAVDHRSDVFSFGTVLFEMLTGRQPFRGDTAADVLASVLVREAEVSGLPADTNPRLIELVTRCLQKNPKRRWQHIGDVRAELEALAAAPRSMIMPAFAVGPPRPWWQRAIVPAACAIAAALIAGYAVWALRPLPERSVVTFAYVLPDEQSFSNAGRSLLAISPDGGTIVYVADRKLYRRALNELQAAPLTGSEDSQAVTSPAFSPDGQSLVFYSGVDQGLKRIPLAGGAPFTLCAAQNPTGIDWSEDGIVFAQPDGGIMRVPASGGKPELLAKLDAIERAHMPQLLPEGLLIYSVATGLDSERWDKAKVVAHSLRSGVRKTLIEGGSAGRYLPSGHLIYAVGSTFFAQLLDLAALEVRGAPMPVLEGVARSSSSQSGAAHLVVSASGTLAYVPGATTTREAHAFELVTADRTGALTRLKVPAGSYDAPRVSRDGRRVAVETNDGKQYAVLVYDLSGGGAMRRVTLDANNRFPIWSAEGTRVTFTSDRDGDEGIFWQAADGAASAERLTRPGPGERHIPESWSPDGETLLFDVINNERHALWTLSMRDRKIAPFAGLASRTQMRASFSPDGAWIAYAMPRDGLMTVQVQPFPATGAKYELLVQGPDRAHDPVWSSDGRALFYVAGPGKLWAVPVTTVPAFTFGNPVEVPRAFETFGPSIRGQYDVIRGGRFIATARSGPSAAEVAAAAAGERPFRQIRIVVNWTTTLEAKVSAR